MPEEKPFPFCGCILEAFYTNEMFDTVCVTYTDEHGVNRDWYMEVDETDERFKSLLKELKLKKKFIAQLELKVNYEQENSSKVQSM